MPVIRRVALTAALAALAACSKDESSPPPANAPPVIAELLVSQETVAAGGTVQLAATAADPDGDPITYSWLVPAGWTLAGDASKSQVSVTAPAGYGESAFVTLSVADGRGGGASKTVAVRTVSKGAPIFRSLDGSPAVAAPGGTISLAAAADTGTEAVTYQWSVSDPAWTLSASGGAATLLAPLAYGGSATVTVVADDGAGGTCVARIAVSTAPYTAPTLGALVASALAVAPGGGIGLSATATSAHGLPLTWSWSVAGSGWTVAGAGATADVTAPLVRSSAAVATVTVTDAAGASASRSLSLTTTNAPTSVVTAAIVGAPTLDGQPDVAVTLDASGSSSTAGGTLLYAWRLTRAPAGAVANLAPSPGGATATLSGSAPGLYGVEVVVADAEGATAAARADVSLKGPSILTLSSGDAQSGTAGSDLPLPLEVVVTTASGARVAGAPVVWRIGGGRFLTSDGASDANGVARATVRLGRIAAAGSATVALRDLPSASVPFTFAGVPGAPASIAVSAGTGTADVGLLVSVRTVDAFGNEAVTPAVESSVFSLAASSASGKALFGADVENATGTLLAGGGTASVVGRLAGGRLDVRLHDPSAEEVTLTLKLAAGASTVLPYSAWKTLLFDSANLGLASGWTQQADVAPWEVVTGPKAASPGRGFGIELAASDVIVAGRSALSRALGTVTSPMVRLDLAHEVAVVGATDTADHCTAQPSFTVALRSAAGAEAPIRPAPVEGWPIQDACDGREGFASAPSFVTVSLDLTDAMTAGYTTLSFEAASSPSPAMPVAAASWYLDDVLVRALLPASVSGAVVTARVLPGAPASVALSGPPVGAVLYRECVTGLPSYELTASILDASGNVAEESGLAFGIGWTGSAGLSSITTGTLRSLGSGAATVQFDAGKAVVRIQDAVAEQVTFSLTDPEGHGLTLGSNLAAPFVRYYCHSTGTGYSWSDTVPAGAMNPTQALRACETHYGAGRCATWSAFAYPADGGFTGTCAALYRWAFMSWGGPCNSYSQASVTPGYWSNYYYNYGYYCQSCAGPGSYGWVQTAAGASWN